MPAAPQSPSPGADGLGAALGHLGRTVRALSGEARALDAGWAVRTPALPLVWSLNQLHVTGPAAPAEVLALADEHQGDLGYRHIEVEDPGTAHGLEALAGPGGWRVEHEVVMVLAGPPDRRVDTAAVIELDEEAMLALMRRWAAEDHPGITPVGLDQLDEYHRRKGRLWGERVFGIPGDDGAPAAVTKLRTDGAAAWVEDVYTMPAARRRGHARTLVTHATDLVRAGSHELTFIVADDDDWPKQLYARLGFEPVGRIWAFHREARPGP
jgi:GNAT superfamily N-acetyltransferase